MKQSLQLRLGQHLTMTPQLQQAIRLLQLSTLELQEEVQQALESNPLLELAEEGESEGGATSAGGEAAGIDDYAADSRLADEISAPLMADEGGQETSEMLADRQDADLALQSSDMPDELPVDSSWDDVYDSIAPQALGAGQEDRDFEVQGESVEGLHEHLMWQMRLTPFSDTDTAIATAIIDAINDDGYLAATLEEIHSGLAEELGVEMDEVEAVLHRVQHFDPPGVAARDLRECLLIQLRQFDPATPWREQAMQLVQEHLDLLASRDYTQLMRRMKLAQPELSQVNKLIQTMNPRPGSIFARKSTEYVIPDVVVSKQRGTWRVELNPEAMPRVRINSRYAGLIRRADNSADNTYLKNHLQEARWFIKSLQSRSETLLKVASCIVERQRAFLDYGPEAMKPLVLHDIAEAVGMHESTISRVTTQKYMHTPQGIFELKYFFSSHVSTAAGGVCSATAIRALIKKLVAAESPQKPLSDSQIADILSQQGINVARRTVAKYREALSISPSSERRRLA
ncbi:MAG: RNA polymerase factor sigma-54 [Pseudomonadota bacterium]